MAEKRETRRSAQTRAMAKVDCWRWLSEWRETGRVTELGDLSGPPARRHKYLRLALKTRSPAIALNVWISGSRSVGGLHLNSNPRYCRGPSFTAAPSRPPAGIVRPSGGVEVSACIL